MQLQFSKNSTQLRSLVNFKADDQKHWSAQKMTTPEDCFIKSNDLTIWEEFKELCKKHLFANADKRKQQAYEKFLKLYGYSPSDLKCISKTKTGKAVYLADFASQKNKFGAPRIPASALPLFSEFSIEDLEKYKPILLSQNDIGIWNYNPQFIEELKNFDEKQIYTMSKLA